ncbi:esterase/lipase family protein [Paraburkholderia sp. J41]|uniref:esterase/lipase family protein n=1 Tax=Paraburkholderia sp. J41 TaxID=2805433 RepID=UPI002AC35E52|nr:alpha/beta hydrolase [Paraburkholderia sp. J41]
MPTLPNPTKAIASEELRSCRSGDWATPDDFRFEDNHNAIFIHGFTGHGSNMKTLFDYLSKFGFNVFIFNYKSSRGIERAAVALHSILDELNRHDSVIECRKVSFVCHSMGGLVARAFTFHPEACRFINKIVTLGTPHNGAFRGDKWLNTAVKAARVICKVPLTGYTAKKVVAAEELLGTDHESAPLIHRLLSQNYDTETIPILSISGGSQSLHGMPLVGALCNMRLQKMINSNPNDGLVPETSSSLSSDIYAQCLPLRDHWNQYPEFDQTNHFNFSDMQKIGLHISNWLRS